MYHMTYCSSKKLSLLWPQAHWKNYLLFSTRTKVCLWKDTFLSGAFAVYTDYSLLPMAEIRERVCGACGKLLSEPTVAPLSLVLLLSWCIFSYHSVFQKQEVMSPPEAQPLFYLKRGKGHSRVRLGEKQGRVHRQTSRCECSLLSSVPWRQRQEEFTQVVGFPTQIWMFLILPTGIWGC